ncbi:unnamed protein product, partial [Closterium sp. NIES-54]
MAADSSIDISSIDRLELIADTTPVSWTSFSESMHVLLGSTTLHNYNLLDLVLDTPFGAAPSPPVAPSSPPPPDPPAPPGPPPSAPPTPSHHDDPDRWARTLRDYTRDHATYVLADVAHKDALAAYTTTTAASAEYAQKLAKYREEDLKYKADSSAWRLADLKALNIILACIPTSLKREIRPTTSAALCKDLTTRFDRQDLNSLLALYRDFQAISLEASPNAATFTRRLTDAARRITDRGITITDSLLMARILDGLPTAYTTHKIAFTTARTGTPSSFDVISWLLDAEADLFHSSSPLTAALVRGGGSGRGTPSSGFGGGRGAGRGGRGGGGRSTPRQGGGRGAGRGGASGLGTLSPCQYLIRYGSLKGQRCLQTTTTTTCFKALTDEWFERGNT